MFKHISYPFKVNAAIAGFGISPTEFDQKFRSEVQSLGIGAGMTAQETALILLSLKIGIRYNDTFELILGTLIHDGKVDTTKPEIIDALYEMGYGVNPYWEHEAITVFIGEINKEELDDMDDYVKSPIAQLFARFRWARIKDYVEQSEGKGGA